MPYYQKSRKDKIINQNIAIQIYTDTVNPATPLNNAQPMARYAECGMRNNF